MQEKINATLVKNIQPSTSPIEIYDTELKGFTLRVQPSGVKSYLVRYRYKGKQTRKALGKHPVISAEKARELAKGILAALTLGENPIEEKEKPSHTLETFLDKVYSPWLSANRKSGDATLARLKSCFSSFMLSPLPGIDVLSVEQWKTAELKRGKCPATINRDITALKALLSKAIDWGFLDLHPLAKLKPAKVDNLGKIRFLSEKEEARLREALDKREDRIRENRRKGNDFRRARGYELLQDLSEVSFADHLKPMVLISLNTGLRRGELFNLTFVNVDLKKGTIRIEGDSTKNGKSRYVPLNKEAAGIFQDWLKQTGETSGLVFPGKEGKIFDTLKTSWGKLLKAADITNFRWHDMRHNFASQLVMAGVDLNTVRELLGHSDMKMTLRYAHLAPEHKAAAVEKLSRG
jgi:integrase